MDPIPKLLKDWLWLGRVKYHPVMTGNCLPEGMRYHPKRASNGNLQTGFRRNAAFVCSHCYASSGASLSWGPSRASFVIRNEDPDGEEGLFGRFVAVYQVTSPWSSKPSHLVKILNEMGLRYKIKKLIA